MKRLTIAAAALIFAGSLAAFSAACQQVADSGSDLAVLEGTVVNAQNGRAVPRASVVLRNTRKAEARSVRADGAGHFIFRSVDPGTYRLSAERPGFFLDTRRQAFPPRVEVAAGDRRQDLILRLLPAAVVTGQIVDESSDPMQHVQVRLLARAFRGGRMVLDTEGLALTDDRGIYRIYGVRPRHYYVVAEIPPGLQANGVQVIAGGGIVGVLQVTGSNEVSPEPEIAYASLFYPDTSDFLQAQTLPIRAGDEAHANFIFFTRPSVSIRGRVTNGLTGGPAENASVAAYWTEYLENSRRDAKVSPQEGTFEVRGLAPGLYTLRASFSSDGNVYTGQQTVEVGPNGIENLLLVALPDAEIAGLLHVDNLPVGGVPPARVAVEFQSTTTAAHSSATSDPTLHFQAQLHPGDHYTVAARNLPQDYYLKAVSLSGRDVERNDVVVSDRRGAMELVLSPNGGHIEGLVINENGQPISGSVVLVPEPSNRSFPDLFRKSGADSKGKFTLRGVPPGTYKLLAFDDVDLDALISQPELLKPYEDQSESVTVSEKGSYYIPLKIIHSTEEEQ